MRKSSELETYLFRVMVRWYRRVVALLDLFTQRVQVHLVPVERTLQGSHLRVKKRNVKSTFRKLDLVIFGFQVLVRWQGYFTTIYFTV